MRHTSILSFFWYHIKPYSWLYAVMLLAPLVGSFYPFVYNYAIKLFLDRMVVADVLTYDALLYPIILFLVAQFALDLVWRISNVAEWKAEPYVRRSILLHSYDYVQHHAYSFFQDNFTGAVTSKLKGLLSGYDKFWAEMHHGLLHRILKSFVGLCALSFVNLNVAFVVWVWLIIYLPIVYKLSFKLNHLAFEESESQHALIGQIADKVTNILSIFSFSSRGEEFERLDDQISHDFVPKQVRVYKYDFKIQIIGGILYCAMFTVLLFQMIHLRKEGLVSIGDFAFVFGMTLGVAEDVWHATVSLQDFSRAMGDLRSALSILQTPQSHLDTPDAEPLVMTAPSIVFKDVCFGYSEETLIFNSLNLSIQPGEKVGIVGHSGAGKSSFVNLLLRYFEPHSGEILVSHHNTASVTQDSLRKQIAVIPQDTLLFHRTLLENIRYGNLEATDADVIEASKKAHIHEFIMGLSERYDMYVGERGIKLSGGQRQRISIARAILKNAPILVLDEATSSLDSQTEMLIQESLNLLIEDKGKTVIAIAHRLSTLKHMDRIIVFDKGQIVEEGRHDMLIRRKNSLYKKLWELQII